MLRKFFFYLILPAIFAILLSSLSARFMLGQGLQRTRSQVTSARLSQMASQLSNSAVNGSQQTFSIRDLPKSNNFTQKLPPDAAYPTPASSHNAERSKLGPRLVKEAAYTYVRPDPFEKTELVGVSKAALRDLAIDPAAVETDDFKDTVSGKRIITLEEGEGVPDENTIYPWAQCYGGYQFGQWAGQLGDGRAISLFETTNPTTGERYELQLKGAGKTPYSRFADGRAVVRSSIREFVVSEALNALGIPSTRALSLTLAPEAKVRREMTEPGAIVARFAQTWLRFGTFDLARSRGDRQLIRKLGDYAAEEVFGGWDKLVAKTKENDIDNIISPGAGVPKEETQGEDEHLQNRYARLYREIVRRNAKMVAWWQAYAFTNGVLNTDNTSIFGLSIDFGPFAFLDNFDPNYTPNHDDHMLRYSYKNQPSIIWWNCVRLGEAFGELLGAGPWCDDPEFVQEGVRKDRADELIKRAETLIEETGEEYKAVFMAEYKRLMTARLGLKKCKPSSSENAKDGDFELLYSDLLDTLEKLELDFNHTFRRLSHIRTSDLSTDEQRKEIAFVFFHHEGLTGLAGSQDDARAQIAKWLERYRQRVLEDWGESAQADEERGKAMRRVNPKFVPRSWVLDEVIERMEKKSEREVLGRVMEMALRPFEDGWGGDEKEEERWCGDVPRYQRAMQCSCSS
ncbi:UPF0061-domain-containing protein [Teratosphaeria nubilosa]|uniref:Selenoprotein O n=1 Tax=Teratosphaeria nubilosa TaxID=161662 RepID=A0A6G1LHI8_9PEZI|nr:UPF0061-domain-containing protein [Teratosphaeria nubilosa]